MMRDVDNLPDDAIDPDTGNTFGPVEEEAIQAAEREIGLAFPTSYRAFLRRFGAAQMLGCELYGLPITRDSDKEMPWFSNVIDRTNSARMYLDWDPPFPHHLICIADDGGGLFFYLDTSIKSSDGGESPVVVSGPSIPLQVVAPSFLEFLRKLRNESEPFINLVKEPPRGGSMPPPTAAEMHPSNRALTWLQIVPDPSGLKLPPLAQYFAVDRETRDVFAYAPWTEIDLEQQMEAFDADAGFFADPAESGGFRHAYVSLDYLIDRHPELPQAALFPQLKRVVLDAYDRG